MGNIKVGDIVRLTVDNAYKSPFKVGDTFRVLEILAPDVSNPYSDTPKETRGTVLKSIYSESYVRNEDTVILRNLLYGVPSEADAILGENVLELVEEADVSLSDEALGGTDH